MSRALWKGAISFGLVHVPVEIYSAEKRHELDFDMLDKRDLQPVGYQRINKKSGKVVPWEQIVKGYEHSKGKYATELNGRILFTGLVCLYLVDHLSWRV